MKSKNLYIRQEDTRPRLYFFEREDGTTIGDAFFMGEIKKECKRAKEFGFKVVNQSEFKEHM